MIRQDVERENQMSIEKKRRGQYHDEISVTGYDEHHEESIGSLSQRTDNVVQKDMPASIHQQNNISGGSSPTVHKNFSTNVSNGQFEVDHLDQVEQYQTNPMHY